MAYILRELLQSFGLEVFVSEKDILAGEVVQSEIHIHIKNCDLLVLCFTNDNKKSPWLLYEAGLACGLNKKVIPILFDNDHNWSSWIDNPMNFTREINVQATDFTDVFIKAFFLPDNQFIRDALKVFLSKTDIVRDNYRKVDIQCEDFVEKLSSIDSFHVQSPEYRDKVAYFYTGFETIELWNEIVNSFMYSGKYLWIYGRKNMKLVLHYKQLFQYLKEKADTYNMQGIDFRCLFLDPASDEVQHAHKVQDIFPSELLSTIKRANHMIGDNPRFQQCFRKYSHKREEVIIRLDNCIIYSKPQFDGNGFPPIMTNSMFQVFSASSPQGKKACQKYEQIWHNATPMY